MLIHHYRHGKDFSREWFKTYVTTNNKRSEQQGKESILRLHLVPFFGEMSLDEITSHEIERYKRVQQTKDFNPKTINNQLTVLSKLLHSAVEWGEIQTIPVIKPLKVQSKKIRFLSQEECLRLYNDHTEPFWRQMVVAVSSEVCALESSSDFTGRTSTLIST